MKNLLLALALCSAAPALAQTAKKATTTKKTTVVKKAPAKKAATPAKKTTTTTTTKTAAAATPAPAPVAPLTEAEAASGLREALTTGITKAVGFASEKDGFNLNDDIRIQFPPDAQLVSTTLSALPGPIGKQAVEQVTNLLNRAAETAAPAAKDIFMNALQQLTLTDALTLVTSSQKDAATQLLRKNSEAALNAALRPSIVQSLDQVGANSAYAKLIERYNKIPLVTPASANLTDYVTKETVDGLFILLAQQEAKIRQNPAAQSTALLKRVFGGK
ncbi:DUF4197 domain-containing protein [Hymenobacter ginsengisoli]|uniref:DUF4197 domain-containing protein n=1 Tax=Hymenobacter ginsengisoli TaxID=1051626 RepID=A0ABP8Q847_9BACT|nr:MULTISPECIES: DUF4197 domain-containing protein [unclassified Hymenobacter]MBO2033600.1 DUF4197 domain-containing protein [Hymenobacter sp. BT559]